MAKTLYLVRHAESDWNTGISDFDRPLNPQGLLDAQTIGTRLKNGGALPEIIFCSPACRAFQTQKQLNLGVQNIAFVESIYEATAETLLGIIRHLDNHYASAMLIGHNPAITRLVNGLCGDQIASMRPCAIATIELDSNSWIKAGSTSAKLLKFDFP